MRFCFSSFFSFFFFFYTRIGIKYGQIALKLFVVYIVRHYRLTTKTRLEDLKFRMTVTLLLTNENMFELHHRTEY